MKRVVLWQHLEDTKHFASRLALHAKAGFVLCLNGDLGAGKTTFVKYFFEALGYQGLVNSPTFTLYKDYDHTPKLIHVDAYRIEDESVAYDMDEVFYDDAITVIEWSLKVPSYLPKDRLELTLIWQDVTQRKVEVSAYGNTQTWHDQLMD